MSIPINSSRIHLYDVRNVLMPRGSMQKESIGEYIKERLEAVYKSWTDKQYGDLPSEKELINLLHKNLMEETERAWNTFYLELKE